METNLKIQLKHPAGKKAVSMNLAKVQCPKSISFKLPENKGRINSFRNFAINN